MSTSEQRRDEVREQLLSQAIAVEFTVEAEEFRVPEWPGLHVTATYEAFGYVTPDTSGDSVTPNGPPLVNVELGDPVSYSIWLGYREFPDWLAQHLVTEFAGQLDSAFLAAVGGQEMLETLAVEEAAK